MPKCSVVQILFFTDLKKILFVFTFCVKVVKTVYISVSHGWLLAIHDDHIKILVVGGNRPPLYAVTGPTDLVSFAIGWIDLCWHESLDKRPSFDCKYAINIRMWCKCLDCILLTIFMSFFPTHSHAC